MHLREHLLAEHVDEAVLLLPDVVQIERVDAELDSSASHVDVLRRVGGDEDGVGHVLGSHVRGGRVELLGQLEVPRQREPNTFLRHWSCAIASAVVLVLGPRQVDLHGDRLALAAALAERVEDRRSTSAGWLTVMSPSAQPPTTRAVSALTAAPNSGGGLLRQAPQPRPVDLGRGRRGSPPRRAAARG